jgi:hypothetical protein
MREADARPRRGGVLALAWLSMAFHVGPGHRNPASGPAVHARAAGAQITSIPKEAAPCQPPADEFSAGLLRALGLRPSHPPRRAAIMVVGTEG